jgi:hypothetical protein
MRETAHTHNGSPPRARHPQSTTRADSGHGPNPDSAPFQTGTHSASRNGKLRLKTPHPEALMDPRSAGPMQKYQSSRVRSPGTWQSPSFSMNIPSSSRSFFLRGWTPFSGAWTLHQATAKVHSGVTLSSRPSGTFCSSVPWPHPLYAPKT